MKCPFCGDDNTRVIDSRPADDNEAIRRRRQCDECGKRFTTYEKVETIPLIVIKKDKNRETYDRPKIESGVVRSCHKRPVSVDQIEACVDEIENKIFNLGVREIESEKIGEIVMDQIRDLDQVAYVRFASVYRQFKDADTFMSEASGYKVDGTERDVMDYIKLIEGAEGEIVEKKSRFIAQIAPVETEEEAYAFIEKIKKKHYDARHNCFAFSVGAEMPLLRFSDDGEPQGTAGKPMLELIQNSGIHDICVVVTRYFGGTLLGTGGLVRAYTQATKEALEACTTKLMQQLLPVLIRTNYTDMGKIQYILNTRQVAIINTEFAEDVVFTVHIPVGDAKAILKEITDATNARAQIEEQDEIFG